MSPREKLEILKQQIQDKQYNLEWHRKQMRVLEVELQSLILSCQELIDQKETPHGTDYAAV